MVKAGRKVVGGVYTFAFVIACRSYHGMVRGFLSVRPSGSWRLWPCVAGPLERKALLGRLLMHWLWVSICTLGILAKWLDPTRLETRTKESDTCASIRVANPYA